MGNMHPIHANPFYFPASLPTGLLFQFSWLPCWPVQRNAVLVCTARLVLMQELSCLSVSVSCVCQYSSLHLSSQFLPLSLIALIPAGTAAGGPVRVSLSLCVFPVIKQLAQDSVHAEYGKGRRANTPPFIFLLRWSPRCTIMQLTCAVNTACSSGTVRWKYWQGYRNKPQLLSRKSCHTI